MVRENGDECCDEVGMYHPVKRLVLVIAKSNAELGRRRYAAYQYNATLPRGATGSRLNSLRAS